MTYLRFEEGIDIDHLSHFGVKGMHWGVWNEETRQRRMGGSNRKPSGKKKIQKKSKGYEKFYKECIDAGYSKAQAKRVADGHEALKKALIVTGAIVGTAALAYVGYKFYDHYADRYLKSGHLLQTVHIGDLSSRIAPGNPFYATYTKADNYIYSSKMFGHFSKDSKISKLYAKQGIKIAGEATSQKTLKELIAKNPSVSYLDVQFGKPVVRSSKFNDYVKAVTGIDPTGGKLSRRTFSKIHNEFSYSLVHRGNKHDPFHKVYYNALKEKGYGAVIDFNDSRREAGGWTFNPVIMFGHPKLNVASSKVASSEYFSSARQAKASALIESRRILRNPANSPALVNAGVYGVGAAAVAGLGFVDQSITVKSNAQRKFAEKYRKEHPGTKLTNAELNAMYKETLTGTK